MTLNPYFVSKRAGGIPVTTQDELTREGGRRLAEFFATCLRIGWKKTDLDWLEGLWLKYHDKHGNVSH